MTTGRRSWEQDIREFRGRYFHFTEEGSNVDDDQDEEETDETLPSREAYVHCERSET